MYVTFPPNGLRHPMIVYTLCCEKDHEFEAWFRDSDTADAQIEETQVVCPVCGTTDVRKALMSPRLAKRQDGADPPPPARQVVDDPGPTDRPQPAEALRPLRPHAGTNCDFVRHPFPEKAPRRP